MAETDNSLGSTSPQLMGILNVTPDSFFDGGHYLDAGAAMARAARMVADGADIIDIGGESTRPGASPVSIDEELRRVVPLVEQINSRLDVTISVDTSKPEVMAASLAAGATMINDVCALKAPGAIAAVAATSARVCLMHMQGEPRTMQENPCYADVCSEVRDFLAARSAACIDAGLAKDRIVLDPGFGFGKTLQHNLELMAGLDTLLELGFPVMVGVSRKSMFASLLGRKIDERLSGGLSMAAIATYTGASIIRTHDVAETADAVRVAYALRIAGKGKRIQA